MQVRLAGRVLDLARETLLDHDGRAIELRPQAYQVLRHLAVHAGRIVGKDELFAAVWPGLVVTDDSLVQAIGDLRRALDDAQHRTIRTVPRRGYLLVPDPVGDEPAVSPAANSAPATGPFRPPRLRRPGALTLAAVVVAGAIGAGFWGWPRSQAGDAPTATPPPMPDRPSIAVLAFRSPEGGEPGVQLARGVAEDVIAQLARNVDLRVVAAASSFTFAGNDVPPSEIGRRLRSRYLVDGSVRRDGELLRVRVAMIDSEEGHVVWSDEHASDSTKVVANRDALVQRIAGTLHSRLRQTEERRVLARPPKTLDVYTMTLRAIALKHRFSAGPMREARALLEQAIAIDAGYAPAWLYLAMSNGLDSLLRLTGEWHPGRYPEMLAQARRAIELDPQLPAAWLALAIVHVEGRRFDDARAAATRCIELGPNDADCLMYLALVEARSGRAAAAVRHIESALDLAPIAPPYMRSAQAQVMWSAGRWDDGLRAADDCLAMAPRFLPCRRHRLLALVELGRLDAARDEARAIRAAFPHVSTDWFLDAFADDAAALRTRAVKAAAAAGIPGSEGTLAGR